MGSVTASTITDIYYIIKKSKSHDIAIAFIKDLVSFTEVLGVDRNTIKLALEKDFVDFEDGVQIISAENHNIDVIITRNEKDFTKTSIAVHSPTEFLKLQNDF